MNINPNTATPEQIAHLKALRIRNTHRLSEPDMIAMSESSADVLIQLCQDKLKKMPGGLYKIKGVNTK